MIGLLPRRRPQNRIFIGQARLLWQNLANLNSRNVGVDRPKFAADFRRRFRLHIIHVDMARPAAETNHDDGFSTLSWRNRPFRFEPQKFGKTQTSERQRAGFKETPPRKPVAKTVGLAVEEGYHVAPSRVGDSVLTAGYP